jgi:hypothetical protein
MKKDVVIGCITNYDYDKIKFWVNSLDRSGFDGLKVMLCYNIDYDVAEELSQRGYTVFAFGRDEENRKLVYNKSNFNICLERFAHIPIFLNKLTNKEEYRHIIATDVRDVVFQSNPSKFLEENLTDRDILLSCESLRYKDEPWGKQNMYLSFGPLIAETMQERPIYNAGVIAGRFQPMLDLFTNIFLTCGGAPANVPGGGGPDQAALNVLSSLHAYKNTMQYSMSESGWAAQLGTTVDPSKIESFKPFLLDKSPILVGDAVCTSDGRPHVIVHQYDRVPEWRKIIEAKYA